MTQQKESTVTRVAERLGVTTGHIRKLCLELGLGRKPGIERFLTEQEVKKLESRNKQVGRPKKQSEKTSRKLQRGR